MAILLKVIHEREHTCKVNADFAEMMWVKRSNAWTKRTKAWKLNII